MRRLMRFDKPRYTSCLLIGLAFASVSSGKGPAVGVAESAPEGVRSVPFEGGFLTPYKATLPGTDVVFEMIPVPGGVVRLGLPEGEAAPEEEGYGVSPSTRVRVEPFWIGRCEVTWAEYWRFMELDEAFTKLKQLRELARSGAAGVSGVLKNREVLSARVGVRPTFVDGVTSPTPLYDPDVTYESGREPNLPAVTMTQYAARQYTKWLSRTTGVDYRLPTEAEWEHAARAGGDGRVDDLAAVAWHDENSDYAAQPVGRLEPNDWGLHDMLGNAAEWVLDDPNGTPPSSEQPTPASEAVVWPTKSSPLMLKGGHWDAAAELCTPASRMLSDDEYWKGSDPNLPTSPWWFADYPTGGVGFRVVRPCRPMDEPTRRRAWEINDAALQADVDHRLTEGRGKLGVVDPRLPEVRQQLNADDVNALLE